MSRRISVGPKGWQPTRAHAGNTTRLVANSRTATEPASPTLPDKNQLIAKVSRVPKVRQLIALRTDRECVSPPRNKITLGLSNRSNSFNHITAVADLASHRPDAPRRRPPVFGSVISFTCRARTGLPSAPTGSSPWRCEMVVIQDFVERESIALEDSTARDLFSIAVFCGLGLLVSLSVLLLDQYVPGDWF